MLLIASRNGDWTPWLPYYKKGKKNNAAYFSCFFLRKFLLKKRLLDQNKAFNVAVNLGFQCARLYSLSDRRVRSFSSRGFYGCRPSARARTQAFYQSSLQLILIYIGYKWRSIFLYFFNKHSFLLRKFLTQDFFII